MVLVSLPGCQRGGGCSHDGRRELGRAVRGHFAFYQWVAGSEKHVVAGQRERAHGVASDHGFNVLEGCGYMALAVGVVHGISEVAEEQVFGLGCGVERQEGELPATADAGERHVLFLILAI